MVGNEERRYRIQSHEGYGFYAGVTPEGKQVLMGLACPNLIAFTFDAEGNLLEVDQRPLRFFQGVTPPYDIYDKRILPHLDAWKMEMRFEPTTIEVKKFFSTERYIGIEDYPSHFNEILNDPGESDEEKRDVRDSMKLWDQDGQFVLLWGNDYWLDESGKVVSS
jgi:hypothetical protein